MISKVGLRSWFVLRFLPPLMLGGGVLWLRRDSPFMETFVASIWIGFAIHSLGWFILRQKRAVDAFGFLPLLFFYSRVADTAFYGRQLIQNWLITSILAYSVYLAITFAVWSPWWDRDSSLK